MYIVARKSYTVTNQILKMIELSTNDCVNLRAGPFIFYKHILTRG